MSFVQNGPQTDEISGPVCSGYMRQDQLWHSHWDNQERTHVTRGKSFREAGLTMNGFILSLY